MGREKKCDENCDHGIIHPQHSTHIQIHWSRENDKIPVLCGRGVPPIRVAQIPNHLGFGTPKSQITSIWDLGFGISAKNTNHNLGFGIWDFGIWDFGIWILNLGGRYSIGF